MSLVSLIAREESLFTSGGRLPLPPPGDVARIGLKRRRASTYSSPPATRRRTAGVTAAPLFGVENSGTVEVTEGSDDPGVLDGALFPELPSTPGGHAPGPPRDPG